MSRAYAPWVVLVVAGCAGGPPPLVSSAPSAPLRALSAVRQDTSPKAALRMVPPEVYLRTYLQLFGALAPIEFQRRARGRDGGSIFDAWDDYVSALGLPDYRLDTPRQTQTNAIMVATFDRLGIALCDRAVEHDLGARNDGATARQQDRLVFAFDLPPGDIDEAAFASPFDVLHRTFLGYPAELAPPGRSSRFYRLYRATVRGHPQADPNSRFTPAEAGWAAVCYGLIRHPEVSLY